MIPVWQRETVWLGAKGIEAKILRNRHHPVQVKSLEALIARPEWKGSTVEIVNGWASLRHPCGATARIRMVPLVDLVCSVRSCKNELRKRRCGNCGRACCPHRINKNVCRDCAGPAIAYMQGAKL